MPNLTQTCVACHSQKIPILSNDYFSCPLCGHESLKSGPYHGDIINDKLDEKKLKQADVVVRFQTKVLLATAANRDFLIDIGSGSGKFLYHIQSRFKKILGIELNEASRRFSREKLDLPVEQSLPSTFPPPSAIIFWHSMEHIPGDELETLLKNLTKGASKDVHMIVSVPNNRSFEYQWYGRNYPYYDVPDHNHQFSPESLNRLLSRAGFKEDRSFFSWAYALFANIQGLLNFANPNFNYLYHRLKRGTSMKYSKSKKLFLDIYNGILLGPAIILGSLLSLPGFFFQERHAIITKSFVKDPGFLPIENKI